MILGEPLSFLLFEAMTAGLFLLCVLSALRRRDRPVVSTLFELLAFLVYGLALEHAAVAGGLYHYGPFALEVGHAPLAVGLGWAVIGFSAMRLSDGLNMPQWVKPFLDALLALLIDLGMDAVAIRDRYLVEGQLEGMWNWGLPFDAQWFGVPFGNLLAWWVVVVLMSGALRSGRYLQLWYGRRWLVWVYPWAALAVALPTFLTLLFTFQNAFGLDTLLLLVGVSLLVVLFTVRGRQERLGWRRDAPVFVVPLAFHLFFLALLLGRRLYADAWGVLALGVTVLLAHQLILLAIERRQVPTVTGEASGAPLP